MNVPDENDPLFSHHGQQPPLPPELDSVLARMGLRVETIPIPFHPLRCLSCGHGRTRETLTWKGVKFVETSGADCPKCGMAGTMGDGRDAFDEEAAAVFNQEQERVEIEDAADKMAAFFNALHDRGVDSHYAGAAMMAFGVGHIEPHDFRDWKRGDR